MAIDILKAKQQFLNYSSLNCYLDDVYLNIISRIPTHKLFNKMVINISVNKIIICIVISLICVQMVQSEQQDSSIYNTDYFDSIYQQLNYKLENLHHDYLSSFQQHYSHEYLESLKKLRDVRKLNDTQGENGKQKIGEYLFLLAKMHLYDVLPIEQQYQREDEGGRYLLAYYYMKISAEQYENADAYYYLAMMDYFKLTPALLINQNIQLEKQLKEKHGDITEKSHQEYEQLIYALTKAHLHNTEHNLYISSLLGNNNAMATLGHMYKNGIGTDMNCTTSLAYFLNRIKNKKVDIFEFPVDQKVMDSFQKQLYRQKELDLSQFGQNNLEPLLETLIFTEETLDQYENIALNHLSGAHGFSLNETRAAQMFISMESQSKLAQSMLGFLFLKGKGVKKDFKKAKQLFQKFEGRLFKQVLFVMKYFGLGFPQDEETRSLALKQLEKLFKNYIKLKQIEKMESEGMKVSSDQKSKYQKIKTPLMKYLIGSLVISQQIQGSRTRGIDLIQESAQEGSTLAIIYLGLLWVDGTDLRYDCKNAINQFDKQIKNDFYYKSKAELAKKGIKQGKLMFSLIKYVQMMSVGIDVAFTNAYYLLKIYGHHRVYRFNSFSWSVDHANKNAKYSYLFKKQFMSRSIEELLIQEFNPVGENMINKHNIQQLTQSTESDDLPIYEIYARNKILIIGTEIHEISILSYEQYKEDTSNIQLLKKIANTHLNLPHIFESRYLLGRYYQQNDIEGMHVNERNKRAFEQYKRATKNNLLATLIHTIQGGEIPDFDILNHLAWYLSVLLAIWFFLNRQKKKRIEEVYENQLRRNREQENQQQPLIDADEIPRKEQKYQGPKFSEQEQEELRNNQIENRLASVINNSHHKEVQQKEQSPQNQQNQQEQPEVRDYRHIWQQKQQESQANHDQENKQENKQKIE